MSDSILAYYDYRYELVVQDQLVFKEAHPSDHAKRNDRDCPHYPHWYRRLCTDSSGINVLASHELKEYVTKCDVCMAHRTSPGKEPLQQHEFAARPWSKVGADLYELVAAGVPQAWQV